LVISRQLLDEIVAHARAEAPNECCGMIAARDGRATAVHRTRNIHASPLRFEMDPGEQLRVLDGIEQAGLELGAIYHSHTRSEPYPSLTDVNLARWWPEPLWVIVGLAGAEPEVRAYRIADGEITDAELEVEDAAPADL
jgi:proteasome lid subunit RPN8/RPN11